MAAANVFRDGRFKHLIEPPTYISGRWTVVGITVATVTVTV